MKRPCSTLLVVIAFLCAFAPAIPVYAQPADSESLMELDVDFDKLAPEGAETPPESAPPEQPAAAVLDKPDPGKSASATPVKAAGAASDLKIGGSLREEIAYRVRSPGGYSKLRHQALLNESFDLSSDLKFHASQRAYYDSVFDVTEYYSASVANDQRSLIELRDFYFDYSIGSFDIRAGKQQIVWGDAVGLFLADFVNGKDFREFILPDFDLIRTPDWALNTLYTAGDLSLETVWLPFPEMNKVAEPGSDFAIRYPVPDGIVPLETGGEEPANSLDNSEAGTRVSYLVDGWQVRAFYFYGWDKSGVPFRSLEDNRLLLDRKFKRVNIAGGTFSKPISDFVLKGEFVFTEGQPVVTLDTADRDGVVTRNIMDSLIGVDKTYFGNLRTNVQLIQRIFGGPETETLGYSERVGHYGSLFFQKGFFDDTIEPELLFVTRLSEIDMMIRPRVSYRATDSVKAAVGADFFAGDNLQLFGDYERSSRVYTELNWYF